MGQLSRASDAARRERAKALAARFTFWAIFAFGVLVASVFWMVVFVVFG